MADINLLQNTNVPHDDGKKYRVLNMLGVVLLVLVVAAIAVVFFLSSKTQKHTDKINADSANITKDIQSQKDFIALSRNQDKLKEMATLLNAHLSWSQVIPKFSEATLKTSKYTKYVANLDGSATITGTVPDFQDLDKLIKGFQLPDFDYIKDVKLTNVALAAEDKNEITYTITVTFDKSKLLELTKAQQSNGNNPK